MPENQKDYQLLAEHYDTITGKSIPTDTDFAKEFMEGIKGAYREYEDIMVLDQEDVDNLISKVTEVCRDLPANDLMDTLPVLEDMFINMGPNVNKKVATMVLQAVAIAGMAARQGVRHPAEPAPTPASKKKEIDPVRKAFGAAEYIYEQSHDAKWGVDVMVKVKTQCKNHFKDLDKKQARDVLTKFMNYAQGIKPINNNVAAVIISALKQMESYGKIF